jgi:hypothetical protein
MKTSLKVIACMAALAVLVTVQSAAAQGKLEGVWRVSEVTFTGANALKITVAPTHPSLFIITKKHFSFLNIANTTGTRPDLPQQGATDAQKVAVWTPVVAWAGTYEVKGNMYTARTIVAKDPSEMAPGNFSTSEFKIEGDTLTFTPKTNQDGPIANPIITKFVRVE